MIVTNITLKRYLLWRGPWGMEGASRGRTGDGPLSLLDGERQSSAGTFQVARRGQADQHAAPKSVENGARIGAAHLTSITTGTTHAMSKLNLLMGASALVAAAAGLAAPASAAGTSQVYGGGSSLIAPYLREAEDCYGKPTPLVVKGVDLTHPTYLPTNTFNYTGTPPQNCATTHVNPKFQLNYISTGSGTGLKGLVHPRRQADFWGDTVPPSARATSSLSVRRLRPTPRPRCSRRRHHRLQFSGGLDPATGLTFATPADAAGQYPIPATALRRI